MFLPPDQAILNRNTQKQNGGAQLKGPFCFNEINVDGGTQNDDPEHIKKSKETLG